MIRVRRAVEILQVARDAGIAVQAVVVPNVAIDALPRRHRVLPGQGEARRVVIELAVSPRHRVVAGLASGRKASCGMGDRADCVVVVGLVAGNARRAGEVVVVVDVAIRTLPWRHRVRSGQRESRAAVIEDSIEPRRRVMALLASLREIRCNVIRVGRTLKILQVARNARRAVQAVVVVDVAIRTLPRRHHVRSG